MAREKPHARRVIHVKVMLQAWLLLQLLHVHHRVMGCSCCIAARPCCTSTSSLLLPTYLKATADTTAGVLGAAFVVNSSCSGYEIFSTVSLSTLTSKTEKRAPPAVCNTTVHYKHVRS
jgi:hypothetical protein